MPRRATETAENLPVRQDIDVTALVIPEDVRNDLLAAQAGSIETAPQLPRYKILPQGVALFEADDQPGETFRTFEGVVLGYHSRNVLWTRPYGEAGRTDEEKLPDCSSQDGKYGVPKEGFRHAALGGAVATGTERIECAACPYNQWNSANLIGKRGKGKAVTNQRELVIMVDGRALPIALVLPPTSLTAFDEYLTNLLNRGIPIQAITTVFGQEPKQREALRWSQATFRVGRPLTQDEFQTVLERRNRFLALIQPVTQATPQVEDVEAEVEDGERAPF